jgi:spore coat protein A, manganese oxidase
MGLATMYLMSDELEDSLPVPKGACDLPIVITDKMFAADAG